MKKNKRRAQRSYSLEFKHHVIKQVITGQLTREEAKRKFNIRGNSLITIWMRTLGYLDPIPLPVKTQRRVADSDENTEDSASLSKQNKELKQLLKQEQMRSEFYQQIIDTAERELGVAIRKKSDVK